MDQLAHQAELRWWPFATGPECEQTELHRLQIGFLTQSAALGFRAYFVLNGDLGAIKDDGKECLIEFRGAHRWNVVTVDHKGANREIPGQPFRSFPEAAAAALNWLGSTQQ